MFRRAKHQQPLAYISVASGPSLSGQVKVASLRDSISFCFPSYRNSSHKIITAIVSLISCEHVAFLGTGLRSSILIVT